MDLKRTYVFNIFNAPKGKASPAGEEIYEWEYLDEKTGEIKKDKKNVKEQINSYVSIVDYKSQIKRGELELNGKMENGTRDFTALPADTVDIYKYLNYLSSLSPEQVTNLLEQANQANKAQLQAAQSGNKESTIPGQTPGATI